MDGAPDKPGIILPDWSAYMIAPFPAESRMTIGHTGDEGFRTVRCFNDWLRRILLIRRERLLKLKKGIAIIVLKQVENLREECTY